MENASPQQRELFNRAGSLRNAVAYGLQNGKRNMIVDLDLLSEILAGHVPVGNNQLPPEDVTALLYEVKKKLGDTTRELGFANVRADQAEALLSALKKLGKKWNWDEFMPLDVYFDQGFDELMSARAELASIQNAEAEAKRFREETESGDGKPEGTKESLEIAARMLDTYAKDCFPANEQGQVHFVRAIMESAASEIRAYLNSLPLADTFRSHSTGEDLPCPTP